MWFVTKVALSIGASIVANGLMMFFADEAQAASFIVGGAAFLGTMMLTEYLA
jgi:hypothetical protein